MNKLKYPIKSSSAYRFSLVGILFFTGITWLFMIGTFAFSKNSILDQIIIHSLFFLNIYLLIREFSKKEIIYIDNENIKIKIENLHNKMVSNFKRSEVSSFSFQKKDDLGKNVMTNKYKGSFVFKKRSYVFANGVDTTGRKRIIKFLKENEIKVSS